MDNQVQKDLKLKECKNQGKALPEPLTNLKNSKYKEVTEIIRHQYNRCEVP